MWRADLLTIFVSYLICLGIQLLAWPLIRSLFSRLPDEGWAVGRVAISLFVALTVWELAYLGLFDNGTGRLFAVVGLVGFLSLWQVGTKGVKIFNVPRSVAKVIALEEYLFVVGFVAMAVIRAHAPSLDSLEKFMDFGFLNQYVLSAKLPVMDMWQAGQTINYYSFGHFWTSVLVRIWGVSPAVGYNLMLAFIFGTSMSLVFLICTILVGKKNSRTASFGGVIGALSVLIAGNGHVIWYFIKNRGLDGYWYAEATRFIHNTIHEFPSYSFVVSDLHGHVLDLPVVLCFLVVLILWSEKRERALEVIMGVLFGVMMMTNTWDVAVYGLVSLVLGMLIIIDQPKELKKLIGSAMVVFVAMGAVSFPWWLSFDSISNGVGLVAKGSPVWQMLVLWGGGVVVSIVGVVVEGRGSQKMIIRTLAISALLLVFIPEIVFARDIYPDHPRANTMFKLTYQAFIMMGILMGATMGKLFDRGRKIAFGWRWLLIVLVSSVFVGTMTFPINAFPTYYNNFKDYFGLNGESWIKNKFPDKYGAVLFLRENTDGRNMIEAVGDSYTLFNIVSVYSGVPTVQGWRVHEWLWRGGYDVVAKREMEVREVYQGDVLETAMTVLQKYKVGWILVSSEERMTYKLNEEKLWQLGEMVWSEGESYLIKVK